LRWLLFLVPVLAAAQPGGPRVHTHQLNGWYMYFGDHPVKGRWELHLEEQWRRHDGILRWQQNLFRPGVNYQLTERVSLTAGYAHIRTYPYGDYTVPSAFNEHRPWQQVIVTQRFGRVRWQHRFRQEQRWVQSAAMSDEWRYRNRFRYFGKGVVPLKGRWFGAFYDEVFINLPPNAGSRKADQNRAYAAIGRRVGRHNSFEIGYLYQVIAQANGRVFEHNHTLQLGFFSRAPFGR
jgi:hypothetical protein